MELNNNIDKIQSYLHNKLSREERLKFEAEIDSNETLRAEVEEWKNLKMAYDNRSIYEFKKKMDEIESEIQSEEKPIFRINPWYRKIPYWAAAVLVIAIGTYTLWHNSDNYDNIVNDSLKAFAGENRSLEKSVDLEHLFSQGEYTQVINKVKIDIKNNSGDSINAELYLMLGMCWIGKNEPDSALFVASEYLYSDDHKCSMYFLSGMAYLQKEEIEMATSNFQLVSKSKKCYSLKRIADDILEKVK